MTIRITSPKNEFLILVGISTAHCSMHWLSMHESPYRTVDFTCKEYNNYKLAEKDVHWQGTLALPQKIAHSCLSEGWTLLFYTITFKFVSKHTWQNSWEPVLNVTLEDVSGLSQIQQDPLYYYLLPSSVVILTGQKSWESPINPTTNNYHW